MIVIEAVRANCWHALAGRRQVVTVQECADELARGDSITLAGYVPVPPHEIDRMRVEPVTDLQRAQLALEYEGVDGLDDGERDLLAHARSRTGEFQICSADKAAVRAAHAMDLLDRVVSLESAIDALGRRPSPPLKPQFMEKRLREWRTTLLLGRPL